MDFPTYTAYTKGMELLYHATTSTKLASIIRKGLLVSKSTGRRKVVWCCRKQMIHWACMHTAQRHKATIKEIVVVAFKVRKKDLRAHGKGLLYSTVSVPPEQIQEILTFALVAQ